MLWPTSFSSEILSRLKRLKAWRVYMSGDACSHDRLTRSATTSAWLQVALELRAVTVPGPLPLRCHSGPPSGCRVRTE